MLPVLRLIGCFVLWTALSGNTPPPSKKKFLLEDSSRLYLAGTSNVNKFTCDCEDRFSKQTVRIERSGGLTKFGDAGLMLTVKNFNCHNRKIDTDMQKALRAEQHPHIRVSLLEARQDPKCLEGKCGEWFPVEAKVNITIAEVTRQETVAAQARRLNAQRFQLRGDKTLQMSAFGIQPPQAMFGMIKVNDWITFHFDLSVMVEDAL
ncbi:MAG TPA: YceI family protein [Saprospiraceae bacterium]|nr:YceI family protein [Saprospiraceae bacterium]HNG91139.1 YceI family protein [Saprospiraceae bacterium]